MTTANVNGITIGYDDEGTGDHVLVLVHGHPFDRSMWRPQVEHFSAAGWRVIAADLRGYGETTSASRGSCSVACRWAGRSSWSARGRSPNACAA